MSGRLISVGNVVVDVLAAVDALPVRGADVWASDVRLAAGGGFNAMAAAARHGVPVAYGGAHGTGPLGDLARAALAAEGIEVLLPPRPGLDTGLVIGIVDGSGERTFVSGRGAETTLGAADLAAVRPEPGDAVLVSGYGLSADLVAWVTALPDAVTVVLDPGPLAPPELLVAAMPRVDWLTLNATEATALVPGAAGGGRAAGADGSGARDHGPARAGVDGGPGEGLRGPTVGRADPANRDGPEEDRRGPTVGRGDASDLARALAEGVRRGVLVRAGAEGCVLAARGGEPVVVPGVPVTAVDTTGAGDTHTGVLVASLLRGADPLAAARAATAAAADSVTRRGPATAPARPPAS